MCNSPTIPRYSFRKLSTAIRESMSIGKSIFATWYASRLEWTDCSAWGISVVRYSFATAAKFERDASEPPITLAASASRVSSSRIAISFSATIARIPGSIFPFLQIGRVIDTMAENMSGRFVPSGMASRCM